MAKIEAIEDLKTEYGANTVNIAVISLLHKGKNAFNKTELRKPTETVNKIFDKLEETDELFPLTREFVLNVLSCEYYLTKFDDLEILTYFKEISNKGGNI